MKNTTIFMIMLVAVLAIGVFFFVQAKETRFTANVVSTGSEQVQHITLGIQNYNYAPNTIHVKAGKPVSLTLDSTVTGCFRSFTIPALGVKGYSQSPSQTIDFTPTQKGTYKYACSMGMGYGTIVVE